MIKIAGLGVLLVIGLQCSAAYPTLDEAEHLFSQENSPSDGIDADRGISVEHFLNDLVAYRNGATELERMRMKDFLLTTLTSATVRVSTNVVDDGTSKYLLERDRGMVFYRALASFQLGFVTNVTDCLSVASYVGRVRTVAFPENLIHHMESVFYVTLDAEKQNEWKRKRRERISERELQRRVRRANDAVLAYRSRLFDLCNACVLANRKIMDDAEFAAFTNHVVELSKPNESEERRLFDRLDKVKRRK